MRALVAIALLACHPVQERHDPIPDEDLVRPTLVTVRLGDETMVSEEVLTPPDYLTEIRPADATVCSHSYRWSASVNGVVTAPILLPESPKEGLQFQFGSNVLRFVSGRDESTRKVTIEGGISRIPQWSTGRRSMTIEGATRCVNDEGTPVCGPAPTVELTVEALHDDPDLPGIGCAVGLEPLPDWPFELPGPCDYAEDSCD